MKKDGPIRPERRGGWRAGIETIGGVKDEDVNDPPPEARRNVYEAKGGKLEDVTQATVAWVATRGQAARGARLATTPIRKSSSAGRSTSSSI